MNKRSHTHIWLCLNLYCTSLFRNRNLNTKRLDSKHAKIYHRGCIINRSFLFFFFLSPKLETSANRAKSIETFGVLPGVESIKSIALARPPPSGPIPFLPIAGGGGSPFAIKDDIARSFPIVPQEHLHRASKSTRVPSHDPNSTGLSIRRNPRFESSVALLSDLLPCFASSW